VPNSVKSLFDVQESNVCFSSAFPDGLYSLLQNKSSVGGTEAWSEIALQGVQLKDRGLKIGENDLLKEFGDIREEDYSPEIRWVGLIFIRALGIGVTYPNWKAAEMWPVAAIAVKRSESK